MLVRRAAMTKKIIVTLLFVLTSFTVFCDDTVSCRGDGPEVSAGNLDELSAVTSLQKDVLFSGAVNPGGSRTEVSVLKNSEGKIEKVQIKFTSGIPGVESFTDKVSVANFKQSGIVFYAKRDAAGNGVGEPILKIKAHDSFTEDGGDVTLNIKQNGDTAQELVNIRSVNDDFMAFGSDNSPFSTLNIEVAVANILKPVESLYVKDYRIN